MKKNIYKLFSRSLETYVFLLIITLIIKLLGGNYFEVALENDTLLRLNDFVEKFRLVNIWYAISIYINVYVVISITCRDNSKSMKKYVLYFMPLIILIQHLKNGSLISIIVDLVYLLIIAFIRLRKFNKNNIINYVSIVILMNLIQIMSIITRNDKISVLGFAISIYNLILNEQQLSNDDVAREVQKNRNKIDEQNDVYLETIVRQNEKIIKMLKGEKGLEN